MLENLFVTFTEGQEPTCETPIPVILGEDTCKTIIGNPEQNTNVASLLYDKDGAIVDFAEVETYDGAKYIDYDLARAFNASRYEDAIQEGDCFNVKIMPITNINLAEADQFAIGSSQGSVYRGGLWEQRIELPVNTQDTTIAIIKDVTIGVNMTIYGKFIFPENGIAIQDEATGKYTLAGSVRNGKMSVLIKIRNSYAAGDTWSATLTTSAYTQQSAAHIYTSNALLRMKTKEDCSVIAYQCEEDALGIPFGQTGSDIIQLLPIFIKKPQYTQDDKTYTTANGRVMVLYAKYYKEWDAETEYLPEKIHDKIIAALSCDVVAIKNQDLLGTNQFVIVTKSNNYEVDWDNKTETECGTKIARATFKVKANTMNRNTNYF